MSKIVLVNIGMHGHVNPTLGFTEELVRRGHEVIFFGDPAFRQVIERTGAQFQAYSTQLGSHVAERSKAQLAGQDTWAVPSGFQDRFIDELEHTYPELLGAFARLAPDVVVYDFIAIAARLATQRLNIPAVQFYTTYASNDRFDLMQHAFKKAPGDVEAGVADRLALLAKKLDLPELTTLDFMRFTEASNLVFMPRSFQLQGETFDARFHFVGPCLSRNRELETALTPAGEDPLVLISLGTIFNAWPGFYHDCVGAFTRSPFRIAMAIGPHVDPASLGDVPPSMTIRAHLPQLAVLKQASLFVTHGGMNSTMEALSLGVPLIVIPQMPEQEMTALRVAELGLGVHLRREDVTAESLASAVAAVHANQDIRSRVRAFQADIAAAGGSSQAVSVIEARIGHRAEPAVGRGARELVQPAP